MVRIEIPKYLPGMAVSFGFLWIFLVSMPWGAVSYGEYLSSLVLDTDTVIVPVSDSLALNMGIVVKGIHFKEMFPLNRDYNTKCTRHD